MESYAVQLKKKRKLNSKEDLEELKSLRNETIAIKQDTLYTIDNLQFQSGELNKQLGKLDEAINYLQDTYHLCTENPEIKSPISKISRKPRKSYNNFSAEIIYKICSYLDVREDILSCLFVNKAWGCEAMKFLYNDIISPPDEFFWRINVMSERQLDSNSNNKMQEDSSPIAQELNKNTEKDDNITHPNEDCLKNWRPPITIKSISFDEQLNFEHFSLMASSPLFSSLIQLEFNDIEDIPATFIDVLTHCNKLQSLRIHNCTFQIDSMLVLQAISQLKQLTDLEFDYVMVDAGEEEYSEAWSTIFKNCKFLKNVVLQCCRCIPTALPLFNSVCSNLRKLEMKHTEVSMNAYIPAISKYCPNLVHLSFNGDGMTDKLVFQLVKGCKKIKNLDLLSCSIITDKALFTIAEHLENLEEIRLDRCHNLTEEGFFTLAQNCKNLRTIYLGDNQEIITDRIILHLSKCCPLLHTVDISNCNAISDRSLCALARNCKNLRTLDLSGLDGITKKSLWWISEYHYNSLEKLSIGGCVLLSDDETVNILKHFKNLNYLSASLDTINNASVIEYLSLQNQDFNYIPYRIIV